VSISGENEEDPFSEQNRLYRIEEGSRYEGYRKNYVPDFGLKMDPILAQQ
jgi:hypothetical protein